MTLQEIKDAIDAGKVVHWVSSLYEITKDCYSKYHICCPVSGACIGLTWKDGTTLNGDESDFYLSGE